MAKLIDEINGSALFAQSAYSAAVATNDSLGRNISETYLTGVDLTNYYTKSQTSGAGELEQAFSNIIQDDTDVSTLVHSNSSTWNEVTNKLNKSESGNFYPMTGNPSGFIVTETDWTNTITAASSYAYNEAIAQIPAPFDPTYISGQIDNKLDKSESGKFYPMSGNPSNFIPQSALNTRIGKISGIGGSALTVGNHNAVTFPLSDGFAGLNIGIPYDNGYLKNLCTDHISEITLTTMPKDGNYKISANSAEYIIPGNSWITFYEQRNSEGEYRWAIKDYNGSGLLTSATSTTTGGGGGTGDMSTTLLEYNSNNQITGYNGTAFAGGGSTVDTIPFVVNSPLVTGFTGTSAYIGLDSTAIDLSQYVPYSALVDSDDGKVHTINGSAICAEHADDSQRANDDSNGDWIAGTYQKVSAMSNYQPSLSFGGIDNTLTSINGSAIGGTTTMESFELSAGNNISIVDDIVNSATIISVSGLSANEWNDTTDVVQANSATWGQGGGTTYTSPSGTIIVSGSTLEGTNSAIASIEKVYTYVRNLYLNMEPDYPYDSISLRAFNTTAAIRVVYGESYNLTGNITISSSPVTELPGTSGGYNLVSIDSMSFLDAFDCTAYKSKKIELLSKEGLSGYATTSTLNTISGDLYSLSAKTITGSPLGTLQINGPKIEATNSAVMTSGVDVVTGLNNNIIVSSILPNYPYNSYRFDFGDTGFIELIYGMWDYREMLGNGGQGPVDIPATKNGYDLYMINNCDDSTISGWKSSVVELALKSDLEQISAVYSAPATGSYVLKCIDGVIQWVVE